MPFITHLTSKPRNQLPSQYNKAFLIGSWCREVGIQESTLFESDGLVLHRQPKNVVLTLLELGRIGEKYGMTPVPNLVKLETEIKEEEEKKPVPPKSAGGKKNKSLGPLDSEVCFLRIIVVILKKIFFFFPSMMVLRAIYLF